MIYEKKLLVLAEALSLLRRHGQKTIFEVPYYITILQMFQLHQKSFIPKSITCVIVFYASFHGCSLLVILLSDGWDADAENFFFAVKPYTLMIRNT